MNDQVHYALFTLSSLTVFFFVYFQIMIFSFRDDLGPFEFDATHLIYHID